MYKVVQHFSGFAFLIAVSFDASIVYFDVF